jgi:hypothetical protein
MLQSTVRTAFVTVGQGRPCPKVFDFFNSIKSIKITRCYVYITNASCQGFQSLHLIIYFLSKDFNYFV